MVTFETSHAGLAPTPFNWCLNDSLLTDPFTLQNINTHIEEYFLNKSTDDISPTSLWSAHKVVLRGHLISIAAAKNKAKLTEMKCLTRDLDNLYNKLSQSPSPDITKQI